MPSSSRTGPFTNTPGTTHDVVVFNANRLKSGSLMASTAAHSNGIDSAGAPASTALIASFSTVQRPLRGGSSASRSSGNRPDAAHHSRTRSSVGGTTGRPSPQPASVANLVNATTSPSATSSRALVSQVTSQPDGPQERSPVVSANSAHLLLRPGLEGIGQHDDAQPRPAGVGRHRVGERFELLRHDGDRRLPPGQCRDRVVDRPGGARASVA